MQTLIGIYSIRNTMLSLGIASALKTEPNFTLLYSVQTHPELIEAIRSQAIHTLIIAGPDASESFFDELIQLRRDYTQLRILLCVYHSDRTLIFKAIKNGASGLITADSDQQELKEAIYTLRAGHEYFSKSITALLVSNYVDAMHSKLTSVTNQLELLGKRELEVLTLWGEGATNAEIAEKLFLSVRTIESHKNHIMQKLQLRTTVDLVKFAIRNNIISI